MSMSFEPGAALPEGFIPLSVPLLGGNEWKYVKQCLDANWVSSSGLFIEQFETQIAEYVGAKYAVAIVNGTSALHIALMVTGVKPDDEVILPTLTFIAPANAVRYAGAWPVFMDVEPDYWQIDPEKLKDFLEKECVRRDGALVNRQSGRRVKAIMPIHILGHPCDMTPIMELAHKYGLIVVEDATESLGAKYKGIKVGHIGDIACFSFNGNKVITTGGGGMIVTDNEEWARKSRYLVTQAKDDPVEYVHHEIGYNYRLTNVQAAIGIAQLERLEEFIASKRRIADAYQRELAGVPGISTMGESPDVFSIKWLSTILVDQKKYGMHWRELLKKMSEEKIQTRPLWQPMHLSPAHSASQSYRIETADRIHAQALSLPSSVSLRDDEISRVTDTIKRNLEHGR